MARQRPAIVLLLIAIAASRCVDANEVQGSNGRQLQQGRTCPTVAGFTSQVGVGNLLNTKDDASSAAGNATALAFLCSASCSCAAFDLDSGTLKTNATVDAAAGVPADACFYTRTDVVTCDLPTFLLNRRVLIVPARDTTGTQCLGGWNSTLRRNPPLGSIGAVTCDFAPKAANDQMFIVRGVNNSSYVTFNDGYSNGTRCWEIAGASTTDRAFLQLSQGPCKGATHQQFAIWTRQSGGWYLVPKVSGKPLTYTLVSGALFQLPAQIGTDETLSQTFTFRTEPQCADVPGYVSWPWGDQSSDLSGKTPFVDLYTVKGAAADQGKACDTDCGCGGFNGQGILKGWAGPPTDVGPFGQCYYQRASPPGCCPDLPGYNTSSGSTIGFGTVWIDVNNRAAAPSARKPSSPIPASAFAKTLDLCNNYCACGGFDAYGNYAPTNFTIGGYRGANNCAYTKQNPVVCSTDNSLQGRRASISPLEPAGACLVNVPVTPSAAVGTLIQLAGCPTDNTDAVFNLAATGDGSTAIMNADGNVCLTAQSSGLLSFQPCPNKVFTAKQSFVFIKLPTAGQYQIRDAATQTQCLGWVFNNGYNVTIAKCSSTTQQRFTLQLNQPCQEVDGYSLVSYLTTPTSTVYKSVSASVTSLAAQCTSDCKCNAFSTRLGGTLRTTDAYPTLGGLLSECYYITNSPQDCNCPTIAGFTALSGRDGSASDAITTLEGTDSGELATRCLADCNCNSFSSTGSLYKSAKASTTAPATTCLYSKPAPTKCEVQCPVTNLQCLTSKFPAARLPKFNLQLPSLPLPGGADLLSYIDPPSLVGTLTGNAGAVAQWASNLQCPGAGLPIFTGKIISSKGFLGPLSSGSCAELSLPSNNSYVTGAMSTAVFDLFQQQLGSSKASQVQAAQPAGKVLAICLAIDPCNLDFHLGFAGVSAEISIPLGPAPPLNLELSFKSISYSHNGEGAGIQEPAVGLWRYNDSVATIPDSTPIVGNLYLKVGVDLSWGYVVAQKKIATITVSSDVEMVTRWSNPTRFALQITAAPSITILEAFTIDFGKTGALKLSLLFYVEHYNEQNWNVYAGVNLNINLQGLLSALLGPLGDVGKAILDPSSQVNVDFNLHISPTGAAVRLLLRGRVQLAKPIRDLVSVFAPDVPTTLEGSIGAKLMIVPINGKNKVFGSLLYKGIEYSYAVCGLTSDCMDDQTCVLGVCYPRLACAASFPKPYVDVSFDGVCRSNSSSNQPGVVNWGRCYRNCRPGYTTGTLGGNSRLCWRSCAGDECGSEAIGTAACFKQFQIFGATGCNIFEPVRSRDFYDRTEDLVCPPGSVSNGATGCLFNCPKGYVQGEKGTPRGDPNTCYMAPTATRPNGCPSKYPVLCGDGNFCAVKGIDCASAIAQNVLGLFPSCPLSG